MKLPVLIPVYNKESIINELLSAVLRVELDKEVIVVRATAHSAIRARR